MLESPVQHVETVLLNAVRNAISFAPPWIVSLVLLVGTTLAAWLVYALVLAVIRRLLRGRQPYLLSVLEQTKNPTRLALLLIAVGIAAQTAPLAADTKAIIVRLLVLGTICLLGWIALTALHIGANFYLARFRVDVADNLLARKHLTQVRVLVRTLDTIIVLVTLGFALMTFDAVRQYGVSLFASAGVAGVVFGLAAQPVLSNLIAGIQIAVTQPIRLEDAVTVQNEYGWIEEINATYVVIRLWDLRRLIVPLNFFIQQPFYNWTRQVASTVGSVLLYLDYAAPVDIIRNKAVELIAQTKRGNPKVNNVQVTNARPDCIEVRVLVTSDSTDITGDVCADLREKLLAFLKQAHPDALPQRRNIVVDATDPKDGGPPALPSPRSG